MPASVVTFDVGQTLVELDLDFLALRLAGRGISVEIARLEAAAPGAYRHYDELTAAGVSHPWHAFITRLLEGAGVAAPEPHVQWLYEQQATHNLWRRPIAPMVELVRELREREVRVAAVSNSEGHVADLLAEIGLAPLFHAIIDSARVGVAKPDPRIFALTLDALGVREPRVAVHVGDSWAADVEGALAAGWQAIWYRSRGGRATSDARVPIATTADETRAALAALGV